MILPFTRTLRGYCRVIKWLNFNIVVYQSIERGKERGQGEKKAKVWRTWPPESLHGRLPAELL